MTYTPSHQARLEDARETGEYAGREWQCLVEDHTWDRDTWKQLIADIEQNPWAPGNYTDNVTDTEAEHLAKTWALHFEAGKHAQLSENARKNTTRSAA